MEPLLPHKVRHPVALAVVLQELRDESLHAHKPAGDCLVYERCLRAPAERVGVAVRAFVYQTSHLLELGHDSFVCILEKKLNSKQWVEKKEETMKNKYTQKK